MAEQLKNLFSKKFVEELSKDIKTHSRHFDDRQFIKDVLNSSWDNRELKDRMHHITRSLHKNLQLDYVDQLKVLDQSVSRFTGFTGTIFPNFVEHFGQKHETESLKALHYYTQFSTGEFAIRPFLKNNPDVIHTLYNWSKDKNYHVRRLASEGCRPLLPWAMKLEQFVLDPKPVLPILEQLKSDKHDYVYRSVANNLNDISKHHPELVLDLGKKWKGKSDTTDWVLKHALRTLLKKGNPKAMNLFGFKTNQSLRVDLFSIQRKKLPIGEHTFFELAVQNPGQTAKFRLEYVISYLKKNGSYNDKVFQITEKEFMQGQKEYLQKKLDFKDLSTRKHYKGKHMLTLKINGVVCSSIDFVLT